MLLRKRWEQTWRDKQKEETCDKPVCVRERQGTHTKIGKSRSRIWNVEMKNNLVKQGNQPPNPHPCAEIPTTATQSVCGSTEAHMAIAVQTFMVLHFLSVLTTSIMCDERR